MRLTGLGVKAALLAFHSMACMLSGLLGLRHQPVSAENNEI